MKKKPFRFGSDVLLCDVLDAHHRFQAETELKLSVCDGFLYHNNRYFRNVRDVAKIIGIDFTMEDYCHYRVFQGAALLKLMETKKIPYFDTVTRLIEIETTHPKRFGIDEIGLLYIFRNFTYHESAHLICDRVFSSDLFAQIRWTDRDQIDCLRIQIAEAIASTHDLFGSYDMQDRISKATYRYCTQWESLRKELYLKVVDLVDFAGAYSCTVMGILHAYMLNKTLNVEDTRRILALLFPKQKFSPSQQRTFSDFMNWCHTLHIQAEIEISNFHFRLMLGNNRDIFDLLNFDCLIVFERNPILLQKLHEMADLFLYGSASNVMARLNQPTQVRKVLKGNSAA